MTQLANRNCPLSEDFFYWPPEEIAQYENWCEAGNSHHKRRLQKAMNEDKVNKPENKRDSFSNII